jgi:hypothetical protein
MPGHLTVLELTDPRWGEFVARQPSATPFHHPDWGKLVATCCPLLAPAPQEEADLVGALRQARKAAGSVLIAEASGQPVAAEVSLSWNGTTISKFSASDERYGA